MVVSLILLVPLDDALMMLLIARNNMFVILSNHILLLLLILLLLYIYILLYYYIIIISYSYGILRSWLLRLSKSPVITSTSYAERRHEKPMRQISSDLAPCHCAGKDHGTTCRRPWNCEGCHNVTIGAVFVIEVCYLCASAMLQILFVFLSVGKTTEHQKLLFVLRYLFFGPNQEAVVNRLKLE